MASNIAKGLGKGVELAEEVRDERSADNLFAGIFTGKPSLKKVFSDWPKPSAEEVAKRSKVMSDVANFLLNKVDIYSIDDSGSVPLEVFKDMAELGLYGLKAPKEFGGMELSNTSYTDVLSLLASWCSAPVIAVSAHNTIGCVFPVMYYGTDEQKSRLLPELIKWPTGFCLTEKDAGSDAYNIRECAVRVRDAVGNIVGYRLSYQKCYTTNGILTDHVPLAKNLAVVARIVSDPAEIEIEKDQRKFCFGLFIVPTDSEGFDIGLKNTFIGMRGIHNSNPTFDNVYVSASNLIGEKRLDWESKKGWGPREGSGIKIAFESLNTGRIAIAKGCVGASKQALNLTRWWANKRSQLGGPLADKELVRDKLIFAAANILAMEAMARYASICFDNGQDVRIEAAAVKIFASEKAWQIIDNLAQTRGGRFYETWQSLSRRELTPPDEILWTGARPNRIFEGANEILVQLMFREGTDKYIKAAMQFLSVKNLKDLFKPKGFGSRIAAFIKLTGYYLKTFASRSTVGTDTRLMTHLEFVDLMSSKLARKILAKSAHYRDKLALKQLMLDRFSRIAISLGAMALTCSYAKQLDKENPGHDYSQLADIFCKATRRDVDKLFKTLDDNDDEYRWRVSKRLLDGNFDDFLLGGIIPMTEEHMRGPKE